MDRTFRLEFENITITIDSYWVDAEYWEEEFTPFLSHMTWFNIWFNDDTSVDTDNREILKYICNTYINDTEHDNRWIIAQYFLNEVPYAGDEYKEVEPINIELKEYEVE